MVQHDRLAMIMFDHGHYAELLVKIIGALLTIVISLHSSHIMKYAVDFFLRILKTNKPKGRRKTNKKQPPIYM